MKTKLWKGFFLFFLLLGPLIYLPYVLDPAHSPVYFVLLCNNLLYFIFYYKELNNQKSNKIINYFILGLGLLNVVSILFISHNSDAVLEFNRWLFFASSYIFFIHVSKDVRWVIHGFLLLGVVYLILGYYEYIQVYNTQDLYKGLYNIRAAIGHKNLLSIYLSIMMPLAFYFLIIAKSNIQKGLYFIFILLGIILIFLVNSRVGYLGVMAFLIGVAIYYFKHYKRFFGWAVLGVISAFIIIHLSMKHNETYQSILKRSQSIFWHSNEINENSRSIQERYVLWKGTLKLIKDYPILGCGLGQWKIHIYKYDINDTRAKYGNIIFAQPHNDFLWAFSETGILGGLLYLGLYLYGLYWLFKHYKEEPIYFWLGLSLLIFGIGSFFDFPKERPQFLYYYAFILGFISYHSGQIKKVHFWIIALMTFLCLLFFAKRNLAEIQMMLLNSDRTNKKHTSVILRASNINKLGIEYDQTSTPLDFYIGESYFFLKNYDSSEFYLSKSIEKNPYHLYSWSNLGSVFLIKKQPTKAVYAWEYAKSIANDFSLPRLNLASYYVSMGEYNEAEKQLHFQMENEDIQQSYQSWNSLTNQLLTHIANSKNDMESKHEIEKIMSDERRKFWLLKSFAKDTLSFEKSVENDISYLKKYPKN